MSSNVSRQTSMAIKSHVSAQLFPLTWIYLNIHFLDSDYLYPDDERAANPATFKFLEMARAWKKSGGDAVSKPTAEPKTEPEQSKDEDEDADADADADSAQSSSEE